MPTIGNTTAFTQLENPLNFRGAQVVYKETATSTFKARYMTHRIGDLINQGGYYFRLVIFSDDSGPDKLLVCSEQGGPYDYTEIENLWTTLKLKHPLTINNGVSYYLGIWNHGTNNVGNMYDSGEPITGQQSDYPESVYFPDKCVSQGDAGSGWSTPASFKDFATYAHDYFSTGILSNGGAIIEWNEHICAIYRTTAGELKIYELNEESPRELTSQTGVEVHGTGGVIAWLAADVDSNGNIHVLSAADSEYTRDFAYNTFNLGTESWGTWEEAHSYSEAAPGSGDRSCALTVDSSNVAHIIVLDGVKDKGAAEGYPTYNNRDGGTWGTPEVISTALNPHGQVRISLAPNGDIEALYYDTVTGDPKYRRRNGTWGTENSYTETAAFIGNVVVTPADVVYRFHMVGTAIEENDVDTTEDVYTGAEMEMWASVGRSGPIVFFVDTNQDIQVYDSRSGLTTLLETGTYVRVVAEYSYENSRGHINWLAENSAGELVWGRYAKQEKIVVQ